jgi:hypothetical protein
MTPIDWNPILVGTLSLAGVMWAGWMTYITGKTQKLADKTHEAVNSERTSMQEEVKRLNEVNSALAVHVAKLEGLVQVADKSTGAPP